jgi:hypothetical protein
MDDMAVEERLENLDHRMTTIEQILPTLATKLDLEAFATKKDLEAFATKKDLEAFATKKDLEAFATKHDLQDGLDALRRHMQMLYEDLIERIKVLGESRSKRRR